MSTINLRLDRIQNHLANWTTLLGARIRDGVERAIDIIVSLGVLVILAPFFGLIAWAIKRDSPGPVFYRAPRMGRDGRPFNMMKFRTMYERPESYQGPKVTAQDDPRVTRVGHWLRHTKLNELPQFWNVLKGEMSLVGPRPEDPTIAKTWSKEVWEEILSVRPGITSPASVQYRNEEDMLSAGSVMQKYFQELSPKKIRMDQLYVRHHSFWLDLDTLLWTAMVMLPKLSSYTPPERLLFVGPITRLIERYLSWFTVDLLVTFSAIGVTGLVWRAFGPLNIGWPMALGMAVGFALLFSLCGAMSGVNRIGWSKAANEDVFELLPAWTLATVLAVILNLAMNHFPTKLVLAAAILALLGFVVVRYRTRLMVGFLNNVTRHRAEVLAARERVLIVGSGLPAQLAVWLLNHSGNAGSFWVIGKVNNDLFKQGMRISGMDVLGTYREIPKLLQKHDVGIVILADWALASQDYAEILRACEATSARLVFLPDILGAFQSLGDPSQIGAEGSCNDPEHTEFPCRYCLTKLISSMMENQVVPESVKQVFDEQPPVSANAQSALKVPESGV